SCTRGRPRPPGRWRRREWAPATAWGLPSPPAGRSRRRYTAAGCWARSPCRWTCGWGRGSGRGRPRGARRGAAGRGTRAAAALHERFDAESVAAALPACTLVSLVPTMLARVLDAGVSGTGRLRCALIGGGPVPPAVLERAGEAGLPPAQTYGLTQACAQVTT